MSYKPTIDRIDHCAVIEVIQLIVTHGSGSEIDDPVRKKVQYWSLEGQLLAEQDYAVIEGHRS